VRHDPSVLLVEACSAADEDPDAFDLRRFAAMATVVIAPDGREHLVLSDGYRRIRLDVEVGSVCHGPVHFRYRLEGLHRLDARILTLRRLIAFCRCGRFLRSLHPPERQAARWIAALRVHDGIRGGASHQAIARALYGSKMTDEAWGRGSSFLRLRVQRLARIGRHMARGGYRGLLS
jgi:hypothetical protein